MNYGKIGQELEKIYRKMGNKTSSDSEVFRCFAETLLENPDINYSMFEKKNKIEKEIESNPYMNIIEFLYKQDMPKKAKVIKRELNNDVRVKVRVLKQYDFVDCKQKSVSGEWFLTDKGEKLLDIYRNHFK